jgi:hypothetical protein
LLSFCHRADSGCDCQWHTDNDEAKDKELYQFPIHRDGVARWGCSGALDTSASLLTSGEFLPMPPSTTAERILVLSPTYSSATSWHKRTPRYVCSFTNKCFSPGCCVHIIYRWTIGSSGRSVTLSSNRARLFERPSLILTRLSMVICGPTGRRYRHSQCAATNTASTFLCSTTRRPQTHKDRPGIRLEQPRLEDCIHPECATLGESICAPFHYCTSAWAKHVTATGRARPRLPLNISFCVHLSTFSIIDFFIRIL